MTETENLKPIRTTDPATLSDQNLAIQFMLEDREMGYGEPDEDRHRALSDEIERRFGPDALENSAFWAVGSHMSCDDIVSWAVNNWDNLRAWWVGDINPDNWEEVYEGR